MTHFDSLRTDDVHSWVSPVIFERGRDYYEQGLVQDLVACKVGLLARVKGTYPYIVWVRMFHGAVASECTCPYTHDCKHAVAALLAYLHARRRGVEIPEISPHDDRLSHFDELLHAYEEERAEGALFLDDYLESLTKEELVALLVDLADDRNVEQTIRKRMRTAGGSRERLVASLQSDIDRIAASCDSDTSWYAHHGSPDFTGVRDGLRALLAEGYPDEVVALGASILKAGVQCVESVDDEGDTAREVAACLNIVFEALRRCSHPAHERMVWAIDADLADGYDLCTGAASFWEESFSERDWSEVADWLMLRLNPPETSGRKRARGRAQSISSGRDHGATYRRKSMVDWTIRALEHAGRTDEIIPLCEQEAVLSYDYPRLVERLLAAGHRSDALRWVHEGIDRAHRDHPGTTMHLIGLLESMKEEDNDWPQVAAIRASVFCADPTLEHYQDLREACERIRAWPVVRAAMIAYLETGAHPERAGDSWPLPPAGLPLRETGRVQTFPLADILIDIYIDEKRPDDILHWYDRRSKTIAGHRNGNLTLFPVYGYSGGLMERVAAAVAETHPARAVALWQDLAHTEIKRTKPHAYDAAGSYLKSIRDLLVTRGNQDEWARIVETIREEHARKRRLMEVLDRL